MGAIAGLVLSGAGVLMQAAGAAQAGEARAADANYQAQVAENNRVISNQNADWTQQAGQQQANMLGMKARANVGSIRAAQAANGVDVNSGSAADVSSAAEGLGQLDVLTSLSNTAREVYGYQSQASNFGAQAGLDRQRAVSAKKAGEFEAWTSLLGGAGKLAGEAGNAKDAGAFSMFAS